MTLAQRLVLSIVCLTLGATFPAAAQTLPISASAPVISTPIVPLFRSSTGADEGVFTSRPIQLSLYTAVGYDDNVFASHSDRVGSGLSTFAVNLASHLGNERTRFDFGASLGFDYYWDKPGKTVTPDLGLNLKFTHQLTPRLALAITSYASFVSEPDLRSGVSPVTGDGNYFYTTNTIALAYQWTPRFSTVTSYTANFFIYEASPFGDTLDRWESLVSQQFRLQIVPTVTAVAEYRFGYIDYFHNNLNSYSNFALVGADVDLSARLSFEFRAGAEFRDYESSLYGSLIDPYFESTLTYLYQPESSIQWYNRYGFEEPNLSTGYRSTFRTGLRIVHALAGRTRLFGGIYYSHDNYHQPTFSENTLEIDVGLSYQLTRSLQLSAGYSFERDFSPIVDRDYYRDRVFLGTGWIF
jgi:Putative beta-barrel porin 2